MTDLAYAVAQTGAARRVLARSGARRADLTDLAAREGRAFAPLLATGSLDALMAAGPRVWAELGEWAAERLATAAGEDPLADPGARLLLPFRVADYVDFYSSRVHASTVGSILRPGGPELPPAWLHLPIGYHGRAGTVVVDGTAIHRPCGLRRPDPQAPPTFGPAERLDVEVEVGFVVGVPSRPGEPLPAESWAEHVFGVVLVNDWSARDIQSFEYVPLGPFLGKSFATSISAWVTPLHVLDAARVPPPPREAPLAPYLADPVRPAGLDLRLQLAVNGTVVSRPPFRGMYWTAAQQLAHLTVNGAAVRTGDLFASGTVSGAGAAERGCLLELTRDGTQPVPLAGGRRLGYLRDGDEVVISGSAPGADGQPVVLGEVGGRVLPARRSPP